MQLDGTALAQHVPSIAFDSQHQSEKEKHCPKKANENQRGREGLRKRGKERARDSERQREKQRLYETNQILHSVGNVYDVHCLYI